MSGGKIYILGCGGHAKSCLELLSQLELLSDLVFVTKNEAEECGFGPNYLVIPESELEHKFIKATDFLILGFGGHKLANHRRMIFEKHCDLRNPFINLISPFSYISSSSDVGYACQVMTNAFINRDAVIGRNVLLNTGCVIEHGAIIGDHVQISPGAVICGDSIVGANSFIGTNAVVPPRLEVPSNTFVKAGLVYSG